MVSWKICNQQEMYRQVHITEKGNTHWDTQTSLLPQCFIGSVTNIIRLFQHDLQEAVRAKSTPALDPAPMLFQSCVLHTQLQQKQKKPNTHTQTKGEEVCVRAFNLKVIMTFFWGKQGRREKQNLHWQGQFGYLRQIRQEVSGSKKRTLLLYST